MNGLGYTLRYFAADLAPMFLFLVIVIATGNIFLATGIGIGLSLVELAWALARRKPIGMLQWAALGLIGVFGSATLLTHDPHFVMVKPTAMNLVLGAAMLRKGWMERYIPEALRAIARRLLNAFGYVWAGLMFATAALNLVLAFTVSPKAWATFDLLFPPISIVVLFVIQNGFMRSRAALAHYDLPEAEGPLA
jgi:intracellular septation protein